MHYATSSFNPGGLEKEDQEPSYAASQETISIILGIPKFKVCKRLRKLEKKKLVRQTTVSKSRYWVRI
ncbi:MAG: hypothetical protein HY513_05905 [Candidatus Aenigmarchaeota archaeon]|nr:hypothetical protein [Candidatus Aenigmarchaeota archaeon]